MRRVTRFHFRSTHEGLALERRARHRNAHHRTLAAQAVASRSYWRLFRGCEFFERVSDVGGFGATAMEQHAIAERQLVALFDCHVPLLC